MQDLFHWQLYVIGGLTTVPLRKSKYPNMKNDNLIVCHCTNIDKYSSYNSMVEGTEYYSLAT